MEIDLGRARILNAKMHIEVELAMSGCLGEPWYIQREKAFLGPLWDGLDNFDSLVDQAMLRAWCISTKLPK